MKIFQCLLLAIILLNMINCSLRFAHNFTNMDCVFVLLTVFFLQFMNFLLEKYTAFILKSLNQRCLIDSSVKYGSTFLLMMLITGFLLDFQRFCIRRTAAFFGGLIYLSFCRSSHLFFALFYQIIMAKVINQNLKEFI